MAQNNNNFQVAVIECNAELFADKYVEYIVNQYTDNFNNSIFDLNAPQRVYEEISNLTEEGIEIL